MQKISIVIVEDMVDIADYFKMILNNENDTRVVGVAYSGAQAVKLVLETNPDIVLMDIQLEHKLAGIEAIEKIKSVMKDVKIIVLTIHEDDEMLYRAYAAGAVEYITKTSSIVDILNAIRSVHKNKMSLRPEVAQKILNELSRVKNYEDSLIYTLNIVTKLTNAEFEVLCELKKGKSYRQVAKERFVEDVTIRTQVNKILKKFDEHNIITVIKKLEHLRIFDIYKTDN